KRVLRLRENADQRILIERIERHHRREAADQLGDQPETEQVVRLDTLERTAIVGRRRRAIRAVEADAALAAPGFDDLLQTIERTTADEQDVLRVDLDVLLLRVLPPALRRDRRDRPFQDLEQRLLHAL